MKKQKKDSIWRILKFVIFSASAGVIQIVTFTLMNEIGHLPYWPSYLTALVLSVLFNFTVNRKFTFKSANNVPLAMLLVAAYYAVFTPLSTLWGEALTNIGWNEYLVLAMTMAINLSTEFLYQRFVVYRNSVDTNAEGQRDSYSSAGEYSVDENGYLATWETRVAGYFVTELAKRLYADPEIDKTEVETPEKTNKETQTTISVKYLGGGSYGKAFLVKTPNGLRVFKTVKSAELASSEFTALKLIKEAVGEFAPEVYALHEASGEIPVAVIEEEYVDGVNLIGLSTFLRGKEKRRALAEQISVAIGKIRSKTEEGYGKLLGDRFGDWKEYYRAYAEDVLGRAESGIADGRVKQEPVELAKEAFARFDEIFSEKVEKACLVHGDINVANIMVDPKTLKLKAIIDPYGSLFGDPEYELFQLRNIGGDRYFLYETVKNSFETSKNCDVKCAFYALINEIDCALVSGTSKGVFFDYMFKTQMKRLRACLANL